MVEIGGWACCRGDDVIAGKSCLSIDVTDPVEGENDSPFSKNKISVF